MKVLVISSFWESLLAKVLTASISALVSASIGRSLETFSKSESELSARICLCVLPNETRKNPPMARATILAAMTIFLRVRYCCMGLYDEN